MILRTLVYMNTTPEPLGGVVAEAMSKAGVTRDQAARIIGRSKETIRRRLTRGNFTDVELHTLAGHLNTRASSLKARAEDRA